MNLTEERARSNGIKMKPIQDDKGRGFELTPGNVKAAQLLQWMNAQGYVHWLRETEFSAVYRTR